MPVDRPPIEVVQEEYVVQGRDSVSRVLLWGIAFVIVCILTVLAYAVIVGVFAPPAPRTQIESSIAAAQAAVAKDSGNGKAWATLAGAQYASGDTAGAWSSIADARKRISDRSILYVNIRELDFLLVEKKDKEAVKRADEFIKTEAQFQVAEIEANAKKGIRVPVGAGSNTDQVRLFVGKATAQGNLQQWKDAVKTLDIAMTLDPEAADVLILRGWGKLRVGDKAGAAKDFEGGLRFLPGDPSGTAGLAEARGSAATTGTGK